jgi:hypothetical protein
VQQSVKNAGQAITHIRDDARIRIGFNSGIRLGLGAFAKRQPRQANSRPGIDMREKKVEEIIAHALAFMMLFSMAQGARGFACIRGAGAGLLGGERAVVHSKS